MREDAHRVDALLDTGGEDVLTEGAHRAAALGVDATVWACTSGSFVYGRDGARRQVEWVRRASGTPASSTSWAFVHALAGLRVSRVTLAATYPEEVSRRFAAFLTAAGIDVVSLNSHGIITAAEVSRLDPNEVVGFVTSNGHPRAGAVLVPDTALHSAHLVEPLEALLGKAVLTADQVSVWEGLRLAGDTRPRASGPGTLFRTGAAEVASMLPQV